MIPTRLVAALAALAVGFAVVLVGVNLDDDAAPAEIADTEPVAPSTAAPVSVPGSDGATEAGAPAAPDASAASDESSDEPTVSEAIAGDALGESFPCSSAAFAVLIDGYVDPDDAASGTQTELFVRAFAGRLSAVSSTSIDRWEVLLAENFDRFTDSACAESDEQAFVEGDTAGLFCASARVSADERLYELLLQIAPRQMASCQLDREQGEK